MKEFANSIAIVTGGAQGIGKAVVISLLQHKSTVIVLDKNVDELTSLSNEAANCSLFTYECDISDENSVAMLIAHVEESIGAVDYLVNVAGIYRPGDVTALDTKKLSEIMTVNFTGCFNVTQNVIKYMIPRKKGALVTISSNAARVPRMGMGAYPISKAALSHYIQCLGLELAEHGIRCNLISPGSTDTAMQAGFQKEFLGSDPIMHGDPTKYRLGIPLQKIAKPEEIADSVLFFLSDRSSHITMHDLVIDGGTTLGC